MEKEMQTVCQAILDGGQYKLSTDRGVISFMMSVLLKDDGITLNQIEEYLDKRSN